MVVKNLLTRLGKALIIIGTTRLRSQKDEVTFNQTDKDTQNPVKPTEMTEKYTIKGDTVYIISSYNGEKNPFCTINENTITVAADGQTIKFAKQE